MPTCFSDSVLDCADDNGDLSISDAMRLLNLHGVTVNEAIEELGSPLALNAEELLAFLGY